MRLTSAEARKLGVDQPPHSRGVGRRKPLQGKGKARSTACPELTKALRALVPSTYNLEAKFRPEDLGLTLVKLTLPYPPSVNEYWKYGRGRVYVGKAGKDFRKEVVGRVNRLFNDRVPTFDGALSVTVFLFPPDRRARDCDNPCKSLLDAIQAAGVYRNDAQIGRLLIQRLEPVNGGSALVEIERL